MNFTRTCPLCVRASLGSMRPSVVVNETSVPFCTGVPAPATHRLHCVGWADWATQPKVELASGDGLLDGVVMAIELIPDRCPDEVGAVREEPLLNQQIDTSEIDVAEILDGVAEREEMRLGVAVEALGHPARPPQVVREVVRLDAEQRLVDQRGVLEGRLPVLDGAVEAAATRAVLPLVPGPLRFAPHARAAQRRVADRAAIAEICLVLYTSRLLGGQLP